MVVVEDLKVNLALAKKLNDTATTNSGKAAAPACMKYVYANGEHNPVNERVDDTD